MFTLYTLHKDPSLPPEAISIWLFSRHTFFNKEKLFALKMLWLPSEFKLLLRICNSVSFESSFSIIGMQIRFLSRINVFKFFNPEFLNINCDPLSQSLYNKKIQKNYDKLSDFKLRSKQNKIVKILLIGSKIKIC